MVIDFHTHTFPAKISARVMEQLSEKSKTKYFTNGSASALKESTRNAGITYSINLPVMTSVEQVEKVNSSLMKQAEELKRNGVLTFGGMHPDYENYRAELRRLKDNGIKGIKIHPAYQSVDLDDIRFLRIIDYASELGLVVITHAGIDVGIYDHNYASTKHVLRVIDEVHPEKFVLAHMGGWGCWDEVERDIAGAPLWLDTAFSIEKITPAENRKAEPIREYNLTEEEFVRLTRKHGVDRVLFGTDSPWEDQKDYVKRVSDMPLTDDEKQMIFADNAVKILGEEVIK